ncbi:MAG: hypothetical protein H7249_03245 [Chitinophagaceae bacterium]|nr:hypothetical protein [Oligoflexus sp.]
MSRKFVLGALGFGVLSAAVTFTACKNQDAKEDSAASSLFDSKKRLIDAQVKSFNDAAKALQDANANNASGCEKRDILWNKIVETEQKEAEILPPKNVLKEVVTFGNGSALRYWRSFTGWTAAEGGSEIRPYERTPKEYIRLTHRYGTLAKMKFVVNKEAVTKLGYTGQYAQGNDCVLARFSSAVPGEVKDRFTPAVAAKFFIGGNNESQVLIVQHDIGGQSFGDDETVTPAFKKSIDNNFYTHYLSNRLSFEKGVLSSVGAFSRFFYSAQYISKNILKLDYTFDPRELNATQLSEKNNDRTAIAAPKGPRFVWYTPPSAEWKAKFGEMAKKGPDFRKHFLSLKAQISEATPLPLYNVYASDTWTYEPEKDATLIGQMQATTPFVVSEAADQRIFFKHSVQFRKIPEVEGKVSPYTQDYAFKDWNDGLFIGDCRLGVRASDIEPGIFTKLDGVFIRDAIFNPFKFRKDAKSGKLCAIGVLGGMIAGSKKPDEASQDPKVEETVGPELAKHLP